MTPSIDQLPIDIYYAIVECLSPINNRGTLYSLMFTSKKWFPAAERQFYHTFQYYDWKDPGNAQKGFLESIALAPRRANYVRVATFHFDPARLPASPTKILKLMINLTLLECWNVETPHAKTALNGCHFPLLTEFAFDAIGVETEMVAFLAAHPRLRKLTIYWSALFPVPPNILPDLDSLGGTFELFSQFCVGRAIKRLHRIPAFRPEVIEQITTNGPYKDVEVLAAGDCPEHLILQIPTLFPNLTKLFLGIIQDPEWVMSIFTQLPRLKRLALLAPSYVGLVLEPDILNVLKKHKTLTSVDITAGGDDGSFHRYVPNSVNPTFATFDEVYDSF
ncbi:hypothetical protein BDN72DRAFT_964405 [Pluteus cervinus]|uniref:Uncharacterized protein n=1 Tax=Pluteus cervinus TaxID=181527 RepID=A0ACD3AAN0_9AGAR|nr:hypothetical protein BDN72DRAFT_964405 [Pluteus cervinus]